MVSPSGCRALGTIERRLERPRVVRRSHRPGGLLSPRRGWGVPSPEVAGVLRAPADSSLQGLMSQRIPQTPGMLRNRQPQVRVR